MRKTPTRSRKALSRRTFVAAGALAAGGGFVPKRVFAQKKVQIKFTLGWLPEGANVWSYAAKQFWSKAGIEVTIEKGTGSAARRRRSPRASTSSASRRHPIDSAGDEGLPLLSLGCFNYDTTMGVAVRPESPIKAPADLKGKKVGSTLTSASTPSCRSS